MKYSVRTRTFCIFFTIVLVVDWALGVLCARNLAPDWLFLITNVPFGFIHSAIEATWTGGQYILLGLTLREEQVNVIYLTMVVAQSCLYFKTYEYLRDRLTINS